MAMPPSKKPAAKKPAAEKKAARQPAAKKPAVKSVIVKSKEVRAGKNVDPGYLAWRKAQSTAERNATIARRKAAAADLLTGAGPILGPALVALMRDPNKPPFNNSFRRNDRWMVPPGGVSNYPVCGANTDEATLNRAFGPHDLYCLEFHGEWKLPQEAQENPPGLLLWKDMLSPPPPGRPPWQLHQLCHRGWRAN